jgi:hypothetical protein
VFTDYKLASKIHCGRTKAEALVENVLAPHSLQFVLKNVGSGRFSAACDASNKGNSKLYQVAIRYFDLENGTTLAIVDFYCFIVRVFKARRMKWAGHVARMGEVRGAYNILVGRPEGRRQLGRPRRRWEDNIEMDLREVGFGDVDWIPLPQDRVRWRALVNTVMTLWVP